MFNLQFYQEFDPHHCVFRTHRLCLAIDDTIITDTYRILDFFLCFPFELSRLNLGRGIRRHHTIAKNYEHLRPYRYSSVPEHVILQMWPFQQVALRGLAEREVLDGEALSDGKVRRAHALPDSQVRQLAAAANSRDHDLMQFIGQLAVEFPKSGEGSLKSRSKLLNYAYEVRTDELLR